MTQTETKTGPTTLPRDEALIGTHNPPRKLGTTVNSTQPIVQLGPCPPWCKDHYIDDDGVTHLSGYEQFPMWDNRDTAAIAVCHNPDLGERSFEIDISVNDKTTLVLDREQAWHLADKLNELTLGPSHGSDPLPKGECPKWCVGECQGDYHHTESMTVETVEQPLAVQLTFGQDDPEPLINMTETFSTLLTRAQALDLASALIKLAGIARKG